MSRSSVESPAASAPRRPAPPSTPAPGATRDRSTLAALLLCIVLGWIGAREVSMASSWGWDESMHAQLPAARMLVALQVGDLRSLSDALQDCGLYPFGYPLLLAAAQGLAGLSEEVARGLGRWTWAAACFGLFLLSREVLRSLPAAARPRAASLAPWIALGLGATSPLAVHYSGTLLLEAPFAAASIFALRAWLRRDGSTRRELAAGAWITAAFFVKFNYGALLLLGLGCALLAECAGRIAPREALRRVALLAAIPLAVGAWWFLWPLPGTLQNGAVHRQCLTDFLGGNLQLAAVGPGVRLLDWSSAVAFTPRVLVLLVLGALAALPLWRARSVQVLALVFLALAVPVSLHPFHLERFLLPVSVPLWALAAVGWSRLLPTRLPRAGVAVLLLGMGATAWPSADGLWLLSRVTSADPRHPAVAQALADKRSLRPGRPLGTNGLPRAQADQLIDLVAEETGPEGTFFWMGSRQRLSRGALHVGLLQRGGSPQRFLRDAHRQSEVSVMGEVPPVPPEGVLAHAAQHDVVFASDPADLLGQASWAFLDAYRDALLAAPGWQVRELGPVPLFGIDVRIFAARRER